MKNRFVITGILFFGVLQSCTKSNDITAHCDGLVTDTAGTYDSASLFVPNAFSPNGDGQNDHFRVVGRYLASIDVKVFEGNNLVYSSQSLQDGWLPNLPLNTYKKYQYRVQATTLANHNISSCGDLYLANCFPPNANPGLYRFQDQLGPNGFTYPTVETPTLNICQ